MFFVYFTFLFYLNSFLTFILHEIVFIHNCITYFIVFLISRFRSKIATFLFKILLELYYNRANEPFGNVSFMRKICG